jgi:hypothetical protein
MVAKPKAVKEPDDLTDAQRYSLFTSVEYHWTRIGENYVSMDRRYVELNFAQSGTEAALVRKGYAERKQVKSPWGGKREAVVLTTKGKKVGEEEFTRRRGKSVKAHAEGLQAVSKKRLEKERKETEKVSNLFKGMVITDRHGRKYDLDQYIFEQLGRGAKPPQNTKVEFSYSQLKKIGTQIQGLVP